MNKVWVWSPPRMGSTSLAVALSILDYKVIHYCPLTHQKGIVAEISESNVESPYSLVSTGTPLCEILKEIVRSKTILPFPVLILTRDMIEWEQSIRTIGAEDWWVSEILRDYRYILDNMPANFFKYKVKDGWKSLCSILGKEIPNKEFPRLNQGPQNWSI